MGIVSTTYYSENLNDLNAATPPPPPVFGASFSDNLAGVPSNARNSISPPTDDWLYTIIGGMTPVSTPVALPIFNTGTSLSGGGGTGLKIGQLQFGANPTYSIAAAIVPALLYPITSVFYTSAQKFVQITFNSNSNIQTGIGIMNFEDISGNGIPGNNNINHDCYLIDDAAGAIRLQRFNSVALPTVLNSSGTWVQGDILRIAFDFTTSSQVTIIVNKNGSLLYQVVDTNTNRLQAGNFPIIAAYSMANGALAEYKNFSCGTGL